MTEVRLRHRPKGRLQRSDFDLADTAVPEPADGEVFVRNLWMSVDPYMWLRLADVPSLRGPIMPGQVLEGAAIGVVVASRKAEFPEGTYVFDESHGWREAYVSNGVGMHAVDPQVGSLSWYLGILGLTGVTAYTAVELKLDPKPGETILISGAAGAVGSVACQFAKRRGARVLASTGSADKAEWLKKTIGVDEAFNYKDQPVAEYLLAKYPKGIDAYIDNVGGSTLSSVLPRMKVGGRVALLGAIGEFETGDYRAGPKNFFAAIERSITLYGVSARAYPARYKDIVSLLSGMMARNELIWRETEYAGIDQAAAAFMALLDGKNIGKMVVRLSDR